MENAAKNLQKLYSSLGDTRTDVRNRNMYELVLSLVTGKTLLDIGCGALHFLQKAKENGMTVEGLEPDEKLVSFGRKLYGNVGKIHSLDILQLSNIRKKYDSITMIDVLEHIEDDHRALKEIKRLIAPGGKLIILVPAFQFLYSERDASIGHFRRYSQSRLQKTLEDSGYTVERIFYWNMIGFLVYGFFEKILKRRAPHGLRTKQKSVIGNFFHSLMQLWVRYVENRVNFGFGLSCIAVAIPRANR
ncbi:MAG: class I SAM-dependent methyltransferase [Patescibacteria group bacterium]|nr:class I SAM-dependent methyltransferase [Patescibacteria group bacterium]